MDELKRDMRLVADHYGCGKAEQREMWEAAMRDLQGATACFRELAREINGK